jgi:hypothetical protein
MKSCEKATWLISKKEEGKLTTRERLMLSFHTGICGMCKKFEKQTAFIARKAKHADNHSILSEDARNNMRKALHDASEGRFN